MKGALIILIVTVVVGFILWLFDRRRNKSVVDRADASASESEVSADGLSESDASAAEGEGECCGLHLVCEKELDAIADNRILYYDDEELDRFAGKEPDEYESEEIEEFRDVLLTLLPQDVPGWARSLDRRSIRPPRDIRDELIILLRDITG